MNCEDVRNHLSALWDNELPEAPARRINEHLACCRECWAVWESLNDLHQSLLGDAIPPVPADLTERISKAARQRVEEGEPATWRRRLFPALRPAFFLRAAAIAALLALGFMMGTSSPASASEADQPADSLEIFDPLPPQTPATAIVGVIEGMEAQ